MARAHIVYTDHSVDCLLAYFVLEFLSCSFCSCIFVLILSVIQFLYWPKITGLILFALRG